MAGDSGISSSLITNNSAIDVNSNGKIFLTNGEEGFKDGDVLYFYYGNLQCLEDVKNSYAVYTVTCLIVIGQPLTNLLGVSSLSVLNELWVVEGKLEDITEISLCKNLKKVYLYCNKIKVIPNLMSLEELKLLSLSNNEISKIEDWNVPKNLQELQIADNKISNISSSCFVAIKIESLNLSGNPIYSFKILDSLVGLLTLRCLVFSDPMHGTCPIVYMNNYRSYAVFLLHQINYLDHTIVTEEERLRTQEYYEDTLFYYRVMKNQLLSKHCKDLLSVAENERRELESIRKHIFNVVIKQKTSLDNSEDCKVLKLNIDDYTNKKNRYFQKAEKLVAKTDSEKNVYNLRYQAELDKIEFELRNVGKYMFRNYEINSTLGTICQKLLNEFICCHLKRFLHLKSVELLRVTHINNSDCPHLKSSAVDSSLKFFIVVSPLPITDLNQWSFSALDHFLMQSQLKDESLITIADCIFSCDLSLLGYKRNDACRGPRVCLIVYTRNSDKILESAVLTCHGNTHRHPKPPLKQCNRHVIRACDVVPSFMIEYRYKEDFKKRRRTIDDNKRLHIRLNASSNIETEVDDMNLSSCETNTNCNDDDYEDDDYNNSKENLQFEQQKRHVVVELDCIILKMHDWKSLTDLILPGSNISSFGSDKALQLVNVHNLDLSYNYLSNLQDVPRIFPNVKTINASFNVINTLSLSQTLTFLEEMDITWNRINRMVIFLLQLKSNAPVLSRLDLRYNPVVDVHNFEHGQHFVSKYLTGLVYFNGSYINSRGVVYRSSDIRKNTLEKLPHAICIKGATNPLTLRSTSELCTAFKIDKLEVVGCKPHTGYDESGKLECLTAKRMTHFHTVLNSVPGVENVRFLDISSVGLDYAHFLRALKWVEEMSLSDNLLRFVGMSLTYMNHLVKLDLSYNYLTSLRDLAEDDLPALKLLNVSCNRIASLVGLECCPKLQELYASHNCLFSLDSIKTIKNLQTLRAISLDHNLVQEDRRFRFFLIYHLHNLEFINGKRIDEEDESVANEEYAGVIDTDYLLRELSGVQLPHLTKLTLSKCSIKELNLDDNCLVNLKVMDLEHNNITSMKGLAALSALEFLNLGWNKINCFDLVVGRRGKGDGDDEENKNQVRKIKHDDLMDPIDQIPEMSEVKTMELVSSEVQCPISASRICAVNEKFCSGFSGDSNNVFDQKSKSSFKQLKVLVLHSNRITSLQPLRLSMFPKLETLILCDNEISTLSGLYGVNTLRNLILDKNKISSISPEVLDDVSVTLTELYLEGNNLKNIRFAKKLTKLKKLFLAQNRIQDVQELKNLENLGLQELTLWGNGVTRCYNYHNSVLECLPDLKRFDGVFLQNAEQEKIPVIKKKRNCTRDMNSNEQ